MVLSSNNVKTGQIQSFCIHLSPLSQHATDIPDKDMTTISSVISLSLFLQILVWYLLFQNGL